MVIDGLEWNILAPYLRKARGQSESSVLNHRSRFRVIKEWFKEKEFNSQNFSLFLDEVEKNGKSTSYQDNCLKLAKHIAHYFGKKEEFDDFKYASDGYSEPEYICSRSDIEKMTGVSMKYERFKDRKIKIPTLIWFIWQMGSRIDETLHLQWNHLVTHPVPLVHFPKEITKGKRRERYCPIPGWLLGMLKKLPKDNERIFARIDPGNFRRDLAERCRIAKIPYTVTPHTLRDSSVNNKLEYGVPIEKVATHHGHAKIDTTYRYYTRIRAKELASSLYQFDPAFTEDMTYELYIQNLKDTLEKTHNSRVSQLITKTIVKNNKKEMWFGIIEK